MSEPSWSHDRQKWMNREKTESRRDNRYTEVVKDPDTGEIVYEIDEPLTDHRGHGSVRRKPTQHTEGEEVCRHPLGGIIHRVG